MCIESESGLAKLTGLDSSRVAGEEVEEEEDDEEEGAEEEEEEEEGAQE